MKGSSFKSSRITIALLVVIVVLSLRSSSIITLRDYGQSEKSHGLQPVKLPSPEGQVLNATQSKPLPKILEDVSKPIELKPVEKKPFREQCQVRLQTLLSVAPEPLGELGDDCPLNDDHTKDWAVGSYFSAGGNGFRYSKRKEIVNQQGKGKYFCVDIGGNIGVDSEQLFQEGFCRSLEIFEILPDLSSQLRNKFAAQQDVCISQAGIGKLRESAYLHVKGQNAEATYINKEASADAQKVEIISAAQYIEALVKEGHDNIFILMNCEGCEYAVINTLGQANLLGKISMIEVQPHKAGLTPFTAEEWRKQHCWFGKYLSATHEKKFDFFLVWEIWMRKDPGAAAVGR